MAGGAGFGEALPPVLTAVRRGHRGSGVSALGETVGYLLTATSTCWSSSRWGGRSPGAGSRRWARFPPRSYSPAFLSPLGLPVIDTVELRRLRALEPVADRVRDRVLLAPRAAPRRGADRLRPGRGDGVIAHAKATTRWASALRWLPTFVGFPLGGLAAELVAGPVDGIAPALAGGAITGAVLGAVQSWGLGPGRPAGPAVDRRHDGGLDGGTHRRIGGRRLRHEPRRPRRSRARSAASRSASRRRRCCPGAPGTSGRRR